MPSAHTIMVALIASMALHGLSVHAQTAPRASGQFGVHLAAGSVNGIRAGFRFFPAASIGLEAAGGYVPVTILLENEQKDHVDGWSATVGGSWYTLPEAAISPMIALLFVYVRSARLPAGYTQQRFALVPALGSEYVFLKGASVFFRFGPAFQFLTTSAETNFETVVQFDAGFALAF